MELHHLPVEFHALLMSLIKSSFSLTQSHLRKGKKNAINSKAVCITDSEVLQELKEKERKKFEEKELLNAKKREREEKK